ncbi:hypothetical protein PAHAL_1G029400 [Panicum hallii]|uniref:Uncharacterized protein n=1 Tax=Panicum hallii TaxID=206008 RepID=A0A2T8KTY1_9POAL|nr:hypothetical protein PAHAL_1G029400 [Panicum hallii]
MLAGRSTEVRVPGSIRPCSTGGTSRAHTQWLATTESTQTSGRSTPPCRGGDAGDEGEVRARQPPAAQLASVARRSLLREQVSER